MHNTERALSYAQDMSFSVFPVHGVLPDGSCTCGTDNCPNTGKHPVPHNGLKSATTDANRIQNMFASPRPYNVAVATGVISGVFVVDVDGMEGEMALRNLEAANSPLPKTLTNLTGRGRHLFFRHPGVRIKTRSSKLGQKLDVRGDGGYVVVPPSLHRTGVYYQWDDEAGFAIADAPQWLVDLVRDIPTAPAVLLDQDRHFDGRWDTSDVESMLAHLDPDMAYDEWVAIGMALHSGGYPMAVYNNWSAGGAKYAGLKDIESKWKSFRPGGGVTMGSLVAMAMTQGWTPPAPERDDALIEVGRRAAEALITAAQLKSQAATGTALTVDFDAIPGVIGDTMKWILSNAQKPQPELAFLNTVAALGAVFGRRYRSPLDTRTNIYMVGLAGTAAGKNHSKKSIKTLMVEADLAEFLGAESIVSGNGVLSGVARAPSQIMHLDEFGMVLEAIMDRRGASHMKIASKVITELYSSSSEHYYGGQYADTNREPISIANPNLCIFGISTVEKYAGSLNRDTVTSGELNRFVVYRASKDNPKRRRGVVITSPPEWLVKAWKEFKPSGGIPQNGMIALDPKLVDWPGLQDRIDDMGDFEDEQIERNLHGAGALWGRYRENAIKIAMIFAIARNHSNPVITSYDLDIAEAITRQSVDYMISMVADHLADSQHERDCKDVLNAIKRKGGRISKTDLCRSTQRMDTKQREAAVNSLIQQDRVYIESKDDTKRAGRKTLSYILA